MVKILIVHLDIGSDDGYFEAYDCHLLGYWDILILRFELQLSVNNTKKLRADLMNEIDFLENISTVQKILLLCLAASYEKKFMT